MKRILLKKPQPAQVVTTLPKPDQAKVGRVAQAMTDTVMKRPR